MHKAIYTKVQGKTYFETKLNNVNQTFWNFYFLCVFGFWHKNSKRLIKSNNVKKFKAKANKQLIDNSNNQQAHNQTQSYNIGSINAWTCCNAYA